MQDSHHQQLCELWAQIVEAESSEEDSSTTIGPPQRVACPYETLADTSPALCQLWCELESQKGNDCCPAKYIGDPEESLLCQLHSNLEDILASSSSDSVTSSPSSPGMPILCDHRDNPTSSSALCELWCEIEARTRGAECLTCPDIYTVNQEQSCHKLFRNS